MLAAHKLSVLPGTNIRALPFCYAEGRSGMGLLLVDQSFLDMT